MIAFYEMVERRADSEFELAVIQAEEINLFYARRLAERRRWWPMVIDLTRALLNHYLALGRRAEYRRLGDATYAQMIDPATLKSREGTEEFWAEAMTLAHSVATHEHQPEAKRLFGAIVEHVHQQLGDLSACDPAKISNEQRRLAQSYLHATRMHLLVSVTGLAPDELAEAAKLGDEAYSLASRLKMTKEAAALALHLGHCYFDMVGSRICQKRKNGTSNLSGTPTRRMSDSEPCACLSWRRCVTVALRKLENRMPNPLWYGIT